VSFRLTPTALHAAASSFPQKAADCPAIILAGCTRPVGSVIRRSPSRLPARDDADERRQANRAVAASAAGLAVTGLAELLLAVLTGSAGLLGDAHNLSDVSTSAVVFLGFRLSRRPSTEKYPYGLERAEDLAGVGIALVIWARAAFAGYESIHKLIEHGHTAFVCAGIAGAVLGIVGNQAVARYKMVVGRRINSVPT
jgi:cation diffusion facilitator family transporter